MFVILTLGTLSYSGRLRNYVPGSGYLVDRPHDCDEEYTLDPRTLKLAATVPL
jgi:hypothetical protein